MKLSNLRGFAVASLAIGALALAGCSGGGNADSAASDTAATAATPTVGGTIKLAYVEWDSCVAVTNVARSVLEDAGYKVETLSVTGAMMYQGLATSDVDATLCAWLPTTHKDYYAKTKDRLENLGANMKGADLGLAVPDYVDITSIPELVDHAAEFDNRIVGIDPGAGLMRLTQKVIDAYGLPEKLVEGSDATMTAVLADSIRRGKPVVVTSWRPHWMWARWDLRYLDDPKHVYGEPDEIDTLVRQGLKQDKPKAYAILDAIVLDADARGAIMAADRTGDDGPRAAAQAWLDAHQDVVQGWLEAS